MPWLLLLPELLSQGSGWLAPSCSPTECWATHCFLSLAVCHSHHSPCLLPSMCISCRSLWACLLSAAIQHKLSWAGLGPSKKSCSEFRDLVDGPLITPLQDPSSTFPTQLPWTLAGPTAETGMGCLIATYWSRDYGSTSVQWVPGRSGPMSSLLLLYS